MDVKHHVYLLTSPLPFSPSLTSLVVSVDVKHHVYLPVQVMELLGRLGDTEAQVAGAAAVAQRNMDNIKPRWDQILPLADDNIRQTAKLTKTDTTIKDVSVAG